MVQFDRLITHFTAQSLQMSRYKYQQHKSYLATALYGGSTPHCIDGYRVNRSYRVTCRSISKPLFQAYSQFKRRSHSLPHNPSATLFPFRQGSDIVRLIEETETHVLIGLLLLLLLLLNRGVLSGTTSGGSTSGSGTTTATRWDGGELGGTLRDQLQSELANIRGK